MAKQMTEMLKGTLEGIVLAILSGRPAYGYEITAWLRDQGFSDIAEGTVYALLIRIEQRGLVDVEKVPSEKGPPRKVYSLNAQGREYLDEFWRTWSFLAERLEQLRRRRQLDMAASGSSWSPDRSSRRSSTSSTRPASRPLPEPYRAAAKALQRYFMYFGPARRTARLVTMFERPRRPVGAGRGRRHAVREIVGDDPVEFAETFARQLPASSGSTRNAPG